MQSTPPCSAPTCWWWTRASGLFLHWELQLGTWSVGIFGFCLFPPSYVPSWDHKTPHRPTGERASWCLVISPPSRLPPQDRSLSLTLLFLFLSFIFCPTSFWREWAAFLGAWCPPPAFSSCSAFKWSFNEFVGEKAVSPSYSSTILGLPLTAEFLLEKQKWLDSGVTSLKH